METTTTQAAPATPASPTPATPSKPKNKGLVKQPKVKQPKVKPAPKKAKTTAARKKQQGKGPSVLKTYAKQYQKPKGVETAGGNQAIDNGDKVAKMLRGKSLPDVYAIAAKHLQDKDGKPQSAGQLRAKYQHLNEGMQRMNLGNRLRAAL